jgi:hypothetical protein
MSIPRFSIAGMMALTVMIALDCLATRVAWGVDDIRVAMLYFGELPWLNVLLIGLAVLRGRRRRGQPATFLVGFEAVGWAALLLSVILIFAFPLICDAVIEGLNQHLAPLMIRIPPFGYVAGIAAAMAILALPQLIAAGGGGLLHRRYRVRIERRGLIGVGP